MRRRGFVRLALQHGASLVPVFHFGENDLYVQASSPWLRRLQTWIISVVGFTVPLFRGRGIFQYDWGVLPRRVPLHTVMGTCPALGLTRVRVAERTARGTRALRLCVLQAPPSIYHIFQRPPRRISRDTTNGTLRRSSNSTMSTRTSSVRRLTFMAARSK